MTARYDKLLEAIATTNQTVTLFAVFALAMVAGWYALAWLPLPMQRPARWLYIASLLGMSILSTVYFGAQ